MKPFLIVLLLTSLFGFFKVEAQSHKKRADSVLVKITLDNSANKNAPVDSVLVILDRFDLSGAGIIKDVVYPVNNQILLHNVPEGKFYITLICLGIYKDNFSDISYVYEKRKNNNEFSFRLKPAEPFDPNDVRIPKEKVDFQKLSIFRKWWRQ
jgi:hypothetical protein